MRHRAFFLALVENGLAGLLRFPHPEAEFGPFARNRGSKFTQDLLVNVRPEFEQRHRAIKADVERAVVGIVETFKEREGWSNLGVASGGTSPKSSAVGQHVHFVE